MSKKQTGAGGPRISGAEMADARASWENWRASHWDELQTYCNGHVLKPARWEEHAQRVQSLEQLFYGRPMHVLQYWASEEALEYLQQHPRITWAEFRRQYREAYTDDMGVIHEDSIVQSIDALEDFGRINRELAAHIVRARESFSWAAISEATGLSRKALNQRVISAYGRLITLEELLQLEAAGGA